MFEGLKNNRKLEVLSLTNTGLTDRTALLLAEAVEKNSTLRVLNLETNFVSPPVIVLLVKSLLQNMSVEEFRASNQVSMSIHKSKVRRVAQKTTFEAESYLESDIRCDERAPKTNVVTNEARRWSRTTLKAVIFTSSRFSFQFASFGFVAPCCLATNSF